MLSAVGEESALVCQSPRVWYEELGIAGPSACRCLYDVVQCQDVNKTMNYHVHFGWDDNVNYRTRPTYLDE